MGLLAQLAWTKVDTIIGEAVGRIAAKGFSRTVGLGRRFPPLLNRLQPD